MADLARQPESGDAAALGPQSHSAQLAGWGNLPVEECSLIEPSKPRELETASRGDQQRFIMRGLGRSYGDASLNAGGIVISSNRLNKMIAFDTETGVIECEAGVSFAEIIEVILPKGFFLPVTPGTRYVTLGGAIAADVHGKNHHVDGSIGEYIESFELLTGSGNRMTCSREQNSDAFFATLGGMGLTGAILSARLQLRPMESAYLHVTYERQRNLESTLDRFMETDAESHYSVAWIDCLATGESLGRGVLMRGEHARINELPEQLRLEPLKLARREPRLGVPFPIPGAGLLMNQFTVAAFNSRYYSRQRDRQAIVHYEPFFYPLDRIARWNWLYGKRGFVQYQVMFPTESSREGLVELLAVLAESRQASFLAVLKSFGDESGGLLSFPAPGHTLALDIPNTGAKLRSLIAKLDAIVLNHGGRVYLAKDALLTAGSVREMYPRLDEFRAICDRLDPDGRWSSSMSRRLKLRQAA